MEMFYVLGGQSLDADWPSFVFDSCLQIFEVERVGSLLQARRVQIEPRVIDEKSYLVLLILAVLNNTYSISSRSRSTTR